MCFGGPVSLELESMKHAFYSDKPHDLINRGGINSTPSHAFCTTDGFRRFYIGYHRCYIGCHRFYIGFHKVFIS